MRALLIATGYHASLEPLIHHTPSPLFEVVGKPILFHIIEALHNKGISEIDLILHHLPEQIEQIIEGGKRWGLPIHCHLVKDMDLPFSTIRIHASQWGDENILLGQADSFPELTFQDGGNGIQETMWSENGKWTGWAVINKKVITDSPASLSLEALEKAIKDHSKDIPTHCSLSATAFSHMLDSNLQALKPGSSILFPSTAKHVEEGIWISRACSIHPSVQISPPVFIGENCEIHQGVELGPNVVIAEGCMIDKGSKLQQSLVAKNSYVGENLDVNRCVVDRNLLIHTDLDTHLRMSDEIILGSMENHPWKGLISSYLQRAFAALMLLLLSPLILFLILTRELCCVHAVKTPIPLHGKVEESLQLLLFKGSKRGVSLLCRIPMLLNLLRGEISLVGMPPRSYEELGKLSPDWQSIYLALPVGIIHPGDALADGNRTDDDLFAAEAYYAAHRSARYNWQLIKNAATR
jgi:carbonic anhydrase/acetyltransferase-like protein (isoleucine patch superfamily)